VLTLVGGAGAASARPSRSISLGSIKKLYLICRITATMFYGCSHRLPGSFRHRLGGRAAAIQLHCFYNDGTLHGVLDLIRVTKGFRRATSTPHSSTFAGMAPARLNSTHPMTGQALAVRPGIGNISPVNLQRPGSLRALGSVSHFANAIDFGLRHLHVGGWKQRLNRRSPRWRRPGRLYVKAAALPLYDFGAGFRDPERFADLPRHTHTRTASRLSLDP
jgi:hypothetical protein